MLIINKSYLSIVVVVFVIVFRIIFYLSLCHFFALSLSLHLIKSVRFCKQKGLLLLRQSSNNSLIHIVFVYIRYASVFRLVQHTKIRVYTSHCSHQSKYRLRFAHIKIHKYFIFKHIVNDISLYTFLKKPTLRYRFHGVIAQQKRKKVKKNKRREKKEHTYTQSASIRLQIGRDE